MSILGRKISGTAVAAVAALIVVASLLPVMTSAPERQITLVARGMAFYLDSDPRTPNPTIEVTAGERVRVVLRNEDRGMTHDFAVPALDTGMDLVRWSEAGEVTVAVPSQPGTYAYVCNPHRLMMHGIIRVVAAPD
jgi:plastocyanin